MTMLAPAIRAPVLALIVGILIVSPQFHTAVADVYPDDDDDDDTPTAEPVRRSTHVVDDDDDDDDKVVYDPEEFEGYAPKEKGSKKVEPPVKQETPAPVKVVKPKEFSDFYAEFAGVVLIVLFGINYFIGRSRNQKLVSVWYRGAMPELQKNFALLGLVTEANNTPDYKPQLTQESQSTYKFYASGRQNCEALNLELELVKRHDLFSILYDIISPPRDTVQFAIEMPDDAMDTFIVAVIARREEANIRQEFTDLDSKVCRSVRVNGLPDSLLVLTDSSTELVQSLLVPSVLDVLQQYAPYVRSIHFSDRINGMSSEKRRGMRATLYITPRLRRGSASHDDIATAMQALTRVVLNYIDKAAGMKLSAKDREKAKALRQKIEVDNFRQNAKAREEEAQERKLQKVRELRQRMANASEAEAAKIEEKLHKMQKKESKAFKLMKMKA